MKKFTYIIFFKNISEHGIKRIDTSPTYSGGRTQEIIGQLLNRGIKYELQQKFLLM